ERTVVEGLVDAGARIHVAEAADPREDRRVSTLQEVAEDDRAHLLECLGEVALEVAGELFTLSFLYQVATEFDHPERTQVPYAFYPRVDGLCCPRRKSHRCHERQDKAGGHLSPLRVMSMIQFVSQVRPPSPEKACSQRQELGPLVVQMYRT